MQATTNAFKLITFDDQIRHDQTLKRLRKMRSFFGRERERTNVPFLDRVRAGLSGDRLAAIRTRMHWFRSDDDESKFQEEVARHLTSHTHIKWRPNLQFRHESNPSRRTAEMAGEKYHADAMNKFMYLVDPLLAEEEAETVKPLGIEEHKRLIVLPARPLNPVQPEVVVEPAMPAASATAGMPPVAKEKRTRRYSVAVERHDHLANSALDVLSQLGDMTDSEVSVTSRHLWNTADGSSADADVAGSVEVVETEQAPRLQIQDKIAAATSDSGRATAPHVLPSVFAGEAHKSAQQALNQLRI